MHVSTAKGAAAFKIESNKTCCPGGKQRHKNKHEIKAKGKNNKADTDTDTDAGASTSAAAVHADAGRNENPTSGQSTSICARIYSPAHGVIKTTWH
jgi:hypothetical protein